MVRIVQREAPIVAELSSLPPVLARIYAGRGIRTEAELNLGLGALLPYHTLHDIDRAVALLLPVVLEGKRLLVVGDFDVDGATSTVLAIRALRTLGATQVDYLVPNRFDFGYGLSPELVAVARERQPDLIMTVDNGIASVAGVAAANEAGIPVLVTDHHLAAEVLPDAAAIVNPNQPACAFPSKAACGCTVVFYLMLALRARLLQDGLLSAAQAPNMAQFLDLVALATVADVVPLDHNNRILVEQGLRRIRAGHCQPGIRALLQVAGRDPERIVAADFGFAVGPRLNAAGRLDDMSHGIECLLTEDPHSALTLAHELDDLNRARRDIEQGMQEQALVHLQRMDWQSVPVGVSLFQADWHQGVIGILASRIKEKVHRPVVAFARGENGELKGSARSIPGLHIRDALDLVAKQSPDLIVKFGGHAMAAGLTLVADGFAEFEQRFDAVCRGLLSDNQLQQRLETDGALSVDEYSMALAEQLRWAGPWGQHFPEPVFSGQFVLLQQRLVGERHLKMVLQPQGSQLMLDAIWFNVDLARWPNANVQTVSVAFQLSVNEFRGQQSLQLMVQALEPEAI